MWLRQLVDGSTGTGYGLSRFYWKEKSTSRSKLALILQKCDYLTLSLHLIEHYCATV